MLIHIVSSPTIKQGCKQAGINRETYYRWTENEAFKNELLRLREEILQESYDQLKFSVKAASQTLLDLCTNEEYPPAVRRGAASDILNHFVKFKEINEIETCITKMEEKLK